MSQTRSPALPSFSGLTAAVNEARDVANNSSSSNNNNNNVDDSRPDSRAEARGVRRESMDGKRRVAAATCNSDASSSEAFGRTSVGSTLTKTSYAHHSSPSTVLLQDTLTPLLDEVDLLFERSKEIVATVKARGNGEDVEVEIMEKMADAWQEIEAKNARHDTSHKLNREKPMFCMDSLGKRIKAALLCKTLPKGDNPAEYVNGADNAPSRNLVTAIKLAGYVVHSGTGGKVSAVDGDGREPPSKYTKEEFLNNVLPRASENQPPRILNELRQLSCRLVASGIAKGLLTEQDLPQIRRILVGRFQDGGMHFLGSGDAAFARFMNVASNAHRLLGRGEIDDFVVFHERVVKLVGMCRNRVRRAAYATSKNMMQAHGGGPRFSGAKGGGGRRGQQQQPADPKDAKLHQQQAQQSSQQSQSQGLQPPPQAPPPPPPPPSQQQHHHQQHPHQAGTAVLCSWRNGEAAPPPPPPASSAGGHARGTMPSFPGQAHYDMLSSATSSGSTYSKPPTENGGGAFGNPLGVNGAALGRAPMSMLPLDTLQSQPSNHGVPVALPPAADGSHVPSSFHEHGVLRAAGPEMLTQMGYRRPQGYGPEGGWNTGVGRSQAGGMGRMDAGPPVLVLQPGWGVSLPPYFLGVMDPKRPRHVPVKMLWELRAEALAGTADFVMVEMKQVAGYMDPLAEIVPPDMLKFRLSARNWETLQGKDESRTLLEETSVALHRLGLVPLPPGSSLRVTYDEMSSHGRFPDTASPLAAMASSVPSGKADVAHGHALPHAEGLMHAAPLGVPPVAAGVLRDLHREGALNGEGVSIWGEGGAPTSEAERVPSSLAGAQTSSSGLRAHSEGSTTHLNVQIMGPWVPPVAAALQGTKRKAGAAYSEHPQTSFSGAVDAEW